MELEKVKKELQNYRRLYYGIKTKKDRLTELKNDLYSLKLFVGGDRVKSGGKPNDRIEAVIDKMTALENQISADILKMYEEQQNISKRIDLLPYPFCEVLTRRYIEFQTIEEIAYKMNYSYDRIKHIVSYDGVKRFSKISTF